MLALAAPVRAQDAPETPKAASAAVREAAAERWLGNIPKLSTQDLLARAEDARKRSAWLDAAKHLAYATGRPGADPKLIERLERDVDPHLSAAEAACIQGWFGFRPGLELQYARAMYAKGRADEGQAQALALVSRGGDAKPTKDAVELLKKSPRANSLRMAPGASQSIFHVALLAPLSGDYEAYGGSLRAGLTLALNEHSARNPLALRLTVRDTKGEGWRAVLEARRSIEDGAGVLVGDILTVPTTALAGIADDRAVPLLSPSATDPLVGAAGSHVFQTGAPAGEQGAALARYVTQVSHRTTIAIPATLDSSFRSAFEAEAVRGGAKVVVLGSATGLRDMRTIAADLRKQRVDALLLPNEPVLAELWVAGLTREKMLLPLLATDAIDPQGFRTDTRAAVENMTVVGQDYELPAPVFARVDSLARATYGLEADRFVRRGYLTGKAITAAIAAGADSPASLTAALRKRSGALGFVHFEESEATLPILSVRRGLLVRVK